MVQGYLDRRTGGLEISSKGGQKAKRLDRRTGGLEINEKSLERLEVLDRRTGGLETPGEDGQAGSAS